MDYIKRSIDKKIESGLLSASVVVIRGPKACGKTETALQFAKSEVNLLYDVNARYLAQVAPSSVLEGGVPRLIDEWQEAASIWNSVKIESDKRKSAGQFILTGSSTVDKSINLHSGAGRFIVYDMSTMTWEELGYSNSTVSLAGLLKSSEITPKQSNTELKDVLRRLVIGGWPILMGKTERQALDINRSYVELLLSDDMSRVSGADRDRKRAMQLFMSLARNVATPVEISTLASDGDNDTLADTDVTLSRQTVYEYLDDMKRLMVVVEQPAWRPHIRSAAALRITPKRHIADPSLAIAALGLSSDALLADLRFTGLLFESQVFHDMQVYARANDAEVSYYRDSYDNEVDIIVENRLGEWAAFEVKLGDVDLDDAAKKLLNFADNIDIYKTRNPSSLNIIVGTGYTYTRPDGVNVVSLSTLGE